MVFFEEAQDILCRAACAWAGVPLREADVRYRASNFALMVDAFGTMAPWPWHWHGRAARSRAEKWMRRVIRQVRGGQLPVGSPAAVVAQHRRPDGALLSVQVAAVELINLIRPIVAISWYLTFAALALHEHPACRRRLQTEPDFAELFVHEVRRYYPFAPFSGARVRQDFTWRGYAFPKGTLVLLDIYGPNRDARRRPQPDQFGPDRFLHQPPGAFDYIPQGGGNFLTGHRCAGEWITIEITKRVAQLLADLAYAVPAQDLSFSLSRMPTFPKSKFIMRNMWRLDPVHV